MPNKHNNRIVKVVDADNKFVKRITPARADQLVAARCADWIEQHRGARDEQFYDSSVVENGKAVATRLALKPVLQLRRDVPPCKGTASQVEARGLWYLLRKRGLDPSDSGALTLAQAGRLIEGLSPYRWV